MRYMARFLAAAILVVVARRKSGWAAAMIAEAASQNDADAARWLLGCLRGIIMTRVEQDGLFCATIAIALSILLFFEWHTDEPLVVLPVLLLVSFVAGLIMPRRHLVSALIIGWAIVCAHALTTATGVMLPRYQKHAPLPGDWLAMSLLVLPSLLAAFIGSRLPRWITSHA